MQYNTFIPRTLKKADTKNERENLEKQGKMAGENLESLEIWEKCLADTLSWLLHQFRYTDVFFDAFLINENVAPTLLESFLKSNNLMVGFWYVPKDNLGVNKNISHQKGKL